MMQEKVSTFMQKWAEFLNEDEELARRIKPFDTFCGGPCPYPGPGPYPPPSLAYDPTGWSKAKGYKSSILDGKELVELSVPGEFTYTVELKEGKFSVVEKRAKEACLSVEMPLSLLKEMILSRHHVVWALTDGRNKITHMSGISLSDWATIFEIFVTAQELVERELKLREIVEAL